MQRLIDIAKNEIGYLEKENENYLDEKIVNAGNKNYTKYARDCFSELQGLSWCCMFVWWCFEKAYNKIVARNLVGEKTAKCSMMKDRMLLNDCEIIHKPQVADIVFFKNDNCINHIGIVVEVNSDNFTTIEGNTKIGNNVVIENGGGVYSKVYKYDNAKIDSFVRPRWDLLSDIQKVKQDYNGEIKATNVNIRAGAGTEYKVVGMESKPYKIRILCKEYDRSGQVWYKIEYKTGIGYVRSDFVRYYE